MNTLVVLAHPSPGSFNRAIADAAADAARSLGHHVFFHDLCRENFDPLLPAGEISRNAVLPPSVDAHCRELLLADFIVVVHPNWWGMPPAILTGWIDRVMRAGIAYRFQENDGGEGIPVGLLPARAALVFNTSDTPPERELSAFGDPLENVWKRCVFGLCGVRNVRRRTFSTVVDSSPELRRQWLAETDAICRETFLA